jgi:hypothetical protein
MRNIAHLLLLIFLISCSKDEEVPDNDYIQDDSPDGNLVFRNPYSINNYIKSEHFAVLWGEGLIREKIEFLLEILEEEHRFFLQMGFLEPPTMANYKFNVYISGTGQVPEDQVLGGLTGRDYQGQERFIMYKDILNNEDALKQVTAHEYFHGIQYAYDVDRAVYPSIPWLGESSAVWASSKAWPSNVLNTLNALPSYAFYPQYPIDDYSLNGSGDMFLLSGHHFGSYLFFDHLGDTYNDDGFVKKFFLYIKSNLNSISSENVFEILKLYVSEIYFDDLSSTFHSFSVRNISWSDYDQNTNVYEKAMQEFPNALNQRIAAEHTVVDNLWHEVSKEKLPRRWGSNSIKLSNVPTDNLEIGFEGNPSGCFGNQSLWSASVVFINESLSTNVPLELINNKINKFQINTNGAKEVWLVVSNTPESANNNEVFGYRYQFAEIGLSEESPNEDLSCN